jgi:hypothetical protein
MMTVLIKPLSSLTQRQKQKLSFTFRDFKDVTLGGPAVFQVERLKRRKSRE